MVPELEAVRLEDLMPDCGDDDERGAYRIGSGGRWRRYGLSLRAVN
jgi:hypothetical protein